MLAVDLGFYLYLAFDDEELMHIDEEKNLQMLTMLPFSHWATWMYKMHWVILNVSYSLM